MGYLTLGAILAAYVLWDGRRRKMPKLWPWVVGTLLFSVLIMPFYLAKRPLREGDVRTGGFGWNVLRHFALFWTLLMGVLMFQACANAGSAMDQVEGGAEQAGAVIGAGLGVTTMGCVWIVPLLGALVIGFFIKKSGYVEEGPTGPLAEQ
jgi:4-amino-4-deoxy-L-arabinose transferase-like glycosyltransferase